MVTSRDVARRAGVSQPTVSRVLNNVPTVAPEIREKVLQALAETGYVANAQAKAMRTSKAGAIGISTTEIQNPFLPYLVDALTSAAQALGLTTIVWNDPNPDTPMAVEAAASGSVDGVIFTAARDHIRGAISLAERGFPIVMCNRAPDDAPVDVVTSDHFGSGASSAGYLLDHGRSNIAAVFGPTNTFAGVARQRGFRTTMADRGVALNEAWVRSGPTTYDYGQQAIRSILDDGRPDAIFCSSDIIAFGVLDGLRAAGVSVPDDIWVCAIDGLPMSSWRSFDLTTRAQDIPSIARASLAAVAARIGGLDEPAQKVLLPTDLIVRGTTANTPAR